MPRDSNGNTVPLPGTIVSTGDTVLPSQHNPMVNDVYAMMTQSLSRDGQGGMRANMDMHGFRILNVGPAILPTDAVSLGQLQNGTPVGAVIDYAGASAPATWMFAYGQAISRAAYPELFSAIGTAYGTGNGTTTFNLPDYRGRIGVCRDDMGGSDSQRLSFFGAVAKALGGVFGSASHELTIDEMPSHDHGGNSGGGGAHSHTATIPTDNFTDRGISITKDGRSPTSSVNINTSTAPDHTHPIPSQGEGKGHTNAQPSIIVNKIIKVSY